MLSLILMLHLPGLYNEIENNEIENFPCKPITNPPNWAMTEVGPNHSYLIGDNKLISPVTTGSLLLLTRIACEHSTWAVSKIMLAVDGPHTTWQHVTRIQNQAKI